MNKSKNEIFTNKLEELILEEVKEKVEKLKGLDVLEVTLELTSKDLYEYIDTNIGDAKHFTLLAKLDGNYEIEVLYYYKNKLIQAVTTESNTGMIDIYTLLRMCVLQQTNIPTVEFVIYKCKEFGKETLDSNELSELNSLADCKCESCESCKYFEKEKINPLKNN